MPAAVTQPVCLCDCHDMTITQTDMYSNSRLGLSPHSLRESKWENHPWCVMEGIIFWSNCFLLIDQTLKSYKIFIPGKFIHGKLVFMGLLNQKLRNIKKVYWSISDMHRGLTKIV